MPGLFISVSFRPLEGTPALLIAASSRPHAVTVLRTATWTAFSSAMPVGTASALPP